MKKSSISYRVDIDYDNSMTNHPDFCENYRQHTLEKLGSVLGKEILKSAQMVESVVEGKLKDYRVNIAWGDIPDIEFVIKELEFIARKATKGKPIRKAAEHALKLLSK